MRQSAFPCLLALSLGLLGAPPIALADYLYTTIDPFNSTNTQANGLNNEGQVVGQYLVPPSAQHAYLLSGGQFARIDSPGSPATLGSRNQRRRSDRGQLCGGREPLARFPKKRGPVHYDRPPGLHLDAGQRHQRCRPGRGSLSGCWQANARVSNERSPVQYYRLPRRREGQRGFRDQCRRPDRWGILEARRLNSGWNPGRSRAARHRG